MICFFDPSEFWRDFFSPGSVCPISCQAADSFFLRKGGSWRAKGFWNSGLPRHYFSPFFWGIANIFVRISGAFFSKLMQKSAASARDWGLRFAFVFLGQLPGDSAAVIQLDPLSGDHQQPFQRITWTHHPKRGTIADLPGDSEMKSWEVYMDEPCLEVSFWLWLFIKPSEHEGT